MTSMFSWFMNTERGHSTTRSTSPATLEALMRRRGRWDRLRRRGRLWCWRQRRRRGDVGGLAAEDVDRVAIVHEVVEVLGDVHRDAHAAVGGRRRRDRLVPVHRDSLVEVIRVVQLAER